MNLKIERENSYELWAKCPYHNDTKASLLISKTGEFAGFAKCFGCGWFGKAEDLGLETANWVTTKSKPAPIDWISTNNLFRENIKAWEDRNKMWMLARKWLVKSGVLEELQCGYTGSAYTFPMCNSDFEITGIQRYYDNGDKKVINGSLIGIFSSFCSNYNNEKLYITEGLSDTAVALDLNLPVIGRYNASSCEDIILDIIKRCDRLKYVTIIMDNDEGGIAGAKKLQKIISKNTNIKISLVKPPVENDLRSWRDSWNNKRVKAYLENS